MDHTVETESFPPIPWRIWQRNKTSSGRNLPVRNFSRRSGASISLDFDKLLFESLTKRGRAIKHNRTHATAWKKYASYIPTKQDHAGLEKYITRQTEKTSTDSIQSGNDEPILLYDDYIYPDNDSLKLEAPELTPAFQPVPLLPIYCSARIP